MAEPRSDGTSGLPRLWRYMNAPKEFYRESYFPYFAINMDTWYYSQWANPNHYAALGSAALGDAPLSPEQGVAAFVARQVAAFQVAFSQFFRAESVIVGYKPGLSGVVSHAFHFAGPRSSADLVDMQTTLEQSADRYEGLTNLTIYFAMRATVRDENGLLTEVWLPQAGAVPYLAHCTDGYVPNLPRSPTVTHLLTPSAQAGIAQWIANLECTFVSLLRESNAEVLAHARTRWQRWLQTQPTGAGLVNADKYEDSEAAGEGEEVMEDYAVTLAVPPPGTPPDNRELAERNLPRIRDAVTRWEQWLGAPF